MKKSTNKSNKKSISAIIFAAILIIIVFAGIYYGLTFSDRDLPPTTVQNLPAVNENQQKPEPLNQKVSEQDVCYEVEDHSQRHRCYSTDSQRALLTKAVEEKNSALCEQVEHVFVGHDVQGDIKKGIIGTLLTDDDARQECLNSIQRGAIHRGG